MLRIAAATGFLLVFSDLAQANDIAKVQKMVETKKAINQAFHQSSVSWLPSDADINRMPEQTVLSERGFYFDFMGRTRRLDAPEQLGCKGGFMLEAHRGHPLFAENSIGGVGAAYSARYNGVELDVRRLGDTTWVFQHDARAGRTFQLASYQDKTLKQITRAEYSSAKELKRDGSLNGYSPETALPVLIAAGSFAQRNQYINVEIKETGESCATYQHLNTLVTAAVPAHQVTYSAMGNVWPLLCIREFNDTSRIAVIQGPGRKALETWTKTYYGEQLSTLRGARQTQLAAKLVQSAFGTHTFPKVSDAKSLTDLNKALGPTMGINVEIQDLVDNPSIITRARKAGIRVMSYSINDNDHHLQALKRLKSRGNLPDGAIVDSTPIKTCKVIGLES